ncbi:hypothetical protein [Bradyrhizobium sp. Leo121]|uniref:hypothetical protein n=1 Tax=Bradyrhizobium sp. Leo121 TaxID=1571195 RepID=UPI0010295C17|nr:hypothetical protein [Bradyrhizobium sp. Leo121]RZN30221.1 hypothetical protein CWO90_21265 [Bradyrhizobium sp. Leo121]
MDSTLDGKLAEGQVANLQEQISNLLAREAGVNRSDPPTSIGPSPSPTSMKPPRAPQARIHRAADWRHVVFVGSLLAASIGVATWWRSSSVHTETMASSDPAPLTQTAPKDAAPTNVAPTPVVPSSDLAQQLQPMARDLAALRQAVEQLEAAQGQLVRDNENVASQLKAIQAEMARNNNIIDQIKAAQIQMTRESATVTERLNASQEQLARVIANTSEPKISPEEPKVTLEIPVPRPRPSTNVAQTHKPAPAPARPQAKNPQPSSVWPWSVR